MMSCHGFVCGWAGDVGNVGCGESVEWPFLLKNPLFFGGFSNKLGRAYMLVWVGGRSAEKGAKKRGFLRFS